MSHLQVVAKCGREATLLLIQATRLVVLPHIVSMILAD